MLRCGRRRTRGRSAPLRRRVPPPRAADALLHRRAAPLSAPAAAERGDDRAEPLGPGRRRVGRPSARRPPLVLVGCSSEFQDDGAIAAAALAGLRERFRLVITTAGVDPASLGDPGAALVERYLPHTPVLPHADVVICHGGMGITQKALAFEAPVTVVPWGRDQLDVAAHVVAAGAGTRVGRRRLSPARLAAAVEGSLDCHEGRRG